MPRDPAAAILASIAFAASFALSVSAAGPVTRASVQSPAHAGEAQYPDAPARSTGSEPVSLSEERASSPLGKQSTGRSDRDQEPQKDLTAFFVIGFIINILVLSVFLFWAVGQWRKTK